MINQVKISVWFKFFFCIALAAIGIFQLGLVLGAFLLSQSAGIALGGVLQTGLILAGFWGLYNINPLPIKFEHIAPIKLQAISIHFDCAP